MTLPAAFFERMFTIFRQLAALEIEEDQCSYTSALFRMGEQRPPGNRSKSGGQMYQKGLAAASRGWGKPHSAMEFQ